MSEPRPGHPVQLAVSLDDGPAAMPAVILGNSVGTTSDLWQPQLGPLRRRFRVLRYEHRGHGAVGGVPAAGGGPAEADASPGRSPAPPGAYTIADLGGDVLAAMDALGVARVAYCGVSLGGMVGMWLASHAPDRITALALVCTSAHLPPADLWTGRAERTRRGELSQLAPQIVSRWFTPQYARAEPAVPAAFQARLEAVDPGGYAGCCDAIAAMDLRADLPAITAPTLVISASEDPATPPWHGAVIAQAIPGAKLRVIRGASHLANYSRPGPVTAALLAHLTAP